MVHSNLPTMSSGDSNDANAWGEDGGNGAAENLEQYSHEQQQTQEPSTSSAVSHIAPGESPEDDADSGEYDPESVVISTTATPVPAAPAAVPPPTASTSSPRPTKKPKKAGGFIVGSSDDEDDTPAPQMSVTLQPQAVNAAATDAPAQPFTHSPQDQPTASHTAEIPTQVSNGQASNQHMPANIIGILEERVKNDPRGDMDAWLALIDETRRHNVVQSSRSVYERFLQTFPQSVRTPTIVMV